MRIDHLIRNVPDFPKPGVQFKDITPLLADPVAYRSVIDWMARAVGAGGVPDVVAGVESRGFLFGISLAERLGVPFVPVRKPGRLPHDVVRVNYELEYGSGSLEVHRDAFTAGDDVVVVDDLLATGGTAVGAMQLVAACGARAPRSIFVIELLELGGRAHLAAQGGTVLSLLTA